MSNYFDKRKSGVSLIGDVSWGTCFCHFYQTEQGLLDVLAPYFEAGLQNNERCVWITSGPCATEEARQALERALPHLDRYMEKQQFEIISYPEWHNCDPKAGETIIPKLDDAVSRGFDGLRLAFDASLEKKSRGTSRAYAEVDSISRHNVIAVVTYLREQFDAAGLLETVKDYRFALVQNAGKLEVLQSTEARIAEDALKETNQRLQSILESISEGFFTLDENLVVTYFNRAAEKLLNRKAAEIVGRKMFDEAFPEGKDSIFEETYIRAMREKKPATLEAYFGAKPYENWYSVQVYPYDRGISVFFQVITERKKTEESLLENESRLKKAQEIAHLGSWELDLVTNTLTWSDEVYRIFGLQPKEFGATYEAFLGAIHPDDRAAVDAAYSGSLREGQDAYEIEHRVVRKDSGEIRYVHEKCQHIRDASGKIIRSLGMVHDITERKATEETLRANQAELSAIMESIPVLTVVMDPDMRVLKVNNAAAKFTSKPVGETLGLRCGEALGCLHSLDDPRGCGFGPACQACQVHLCALDTLKTGSSHYQMEWQRPFMRYGKTEEISFLFSTVLLETPKKQLLLCIEDITDVKKAEEALRASQMQLSAILASVPILTMVVDEERRVLEVNDAVARFANGDVKEMLGLLNGEALGCLHSLDDPRGCGFGPSCQTCQVRLNVLNTFDTGTNHYKTEWHLPFMRDGKTEELTFLFSTTLLPTPKKQVLICIDDITDIKRAETEVKELNEELKERAAELEAANKELEAFSYSVSHDLRAPLRSMAGFSDALLEDYGASLDKQGKQYLNWIRESGEVMGQLIDDLLQLSRVTRAEMRREPVDLSTMARDILAELKKAQPERGIECAVTPGLTCRGDTRLLRLVLENLLENAWKFTARVPSPWIEVSVTEIDGRCVYFVRDNGAGFNMAYVEKLFRPFQRLHLASDYPGTGIGLATVQRIIHRHGGRVWAEGKENEGATFYFSLD